MTAAKTAIAFAPRARRRIRQGVDLVAGAVNVTLGPLGGCVALAAKSGPPRVLRDGALVAEEIEPDDIFRHLAGRLVRQAASKTNDAAGDGTTTTVVLLQAIVREGVRLIAAGANPMILRQEIERAARVADAALAAMATPATGEATFVRIAQLAAGDGELGQLLGEAMAWAGAEGTVAVIEGRLTTTEVELTEGYLFDRGYLAPHFVTHAERDAAIVDDPAILLTDQTVDTASDLLPILERLLGVGKRDLVVVARDVAPEPLALLAQNKLRGVLNVLAVKAPEFDERRTAALDDLALVVGGTLLSAEGGRRLADATLDDLGRADQVISRRDRTAVVGGRGDQAAVAARIRQINHELGKQTVRFHREKLEARLVRLGGRVVEIRVGGATALAIKERKTRLDDANHALGAAIAEGVVPGGGVALLNAAACLDTADSLGAAVLARALEEPLRRLVANAGAEPSVAVAEVRRRQQVTGTPAIGYDVLTQCYVDLIDEGIVDPLGVVRATLRHAVSAAVMLLTSEVLIAPVPIDEAARRRKQRKPWPGLATGA